MGKRSLMVGIIAALALLLGAAQALAVTPTTCATLAADIAGATDGEVLQLPAVTCTVNLTITNTASFTLEGASGGGTVLQPIATTTPIIQAPDPAPVRFTLSGLTFTGITGGLGAIWLQDPGEAVTITGDTFLNNSAAGSFGAAVDIQTQSNPGTLATQPTVISDNTFTGNHAGGGGAVAMLGSNPITVSGNTFTANSAGLNGGALVIGGNAAASTNPVQITDNMFGGSASSAGNTARDLGGGAEIDLGQGQPLTVSGNTFENNMLTGTVSIDDREGAGLYINGEDDTTGAIAQAHNTIMDNVLASTTTNTNLVASGAGEFVLGATVHSTADTFIDNRISSNDGKPPEGGALGVLASASPVQAGGFVGTNDLFKGNSTAAGGWGGAVYVGGPPATCTGSCPASNLALTNATVVGNSVDAGSGSEGGAIWGSPNDSLTLHNAILYGNAPASEIFGFGSNPPTVTSSDTCNEAGGPSIPGATAGNLCSDPKLDASGNETALSPTLDAGSDALVPSGLTTDIAGNPRIRANRLTCSGLGPAVVDMGAFEFTSTSTPPLCPVQIPIVVIVSKKLKDRSGAARLKLKCSAGHSYCDGTVMLKLSKHGHLLLGRAHFHIAVGHSATVKLKLRAKRLRKLKPAKSARVLIAIAYHDGGGMHATTSRKATLKLPKKRSH